MSRQRNIFRDSALKYAALGWPIFPLAEGAKVPMNDSDGFKSASLDRAQIALWQAQYPHNNIGAATGQASGIFVVDLDPGSGADVTVRKLASQGKHFPPTVEARSPRNGRHLYYAYDRRATITKAHSLGQGIDTRGDGGYIVLPPSWWRDTQSGYRWVVPPRGSVLTPLPAWAIGALTPPPPRKVERKPIDLSNLTGYRRQALADLDEACRRMAALQDGRHEAPFKTAALLGKYVHNSLLTEADLEQAILSACSSNGALRKYNRGDLCKQIRNGLNKASGDALPQLARLRPRPNRQEARRD
jgi:Bifunctional DNA primase/polymerase, N-terminal